MFFRVLAKVGTMALYLVLEAVQIQGDGPVEVLSEAPVSVRKLSVIPENEPDPGKADTDQASHDPQLPREKDSSTSLFTVNKYSRNSSSSDSLSTSSHQTDTGADCAGIVLNCLFCRFYDLFLMLPNSCDEVTYCCCPSYRQYSSSVEAIPSNDCNCNFDFDCGLFDTCQETGSSSRAHSPNSISPQTLSHSPNKTSPQTLSHSPNSISPQTLSHSPNKTSPQTLSHSPNTTSPQTLSHSPNTASPQTLSHSPNSISPQTLSHSPNKTSPQTLSQP
nr:putative protein TPRXL [Oncorhynchus nerka]